MKQRTLGILGGALLVGGVVLGIASGIVSNRIAPVDRTPMARPHVGPIQEHGGPGQPGPFFGDPRQHRRLPRFRTAVPERHQAQAAGQSVAVGLNQLPDDLYSPKVVRGAGAPLTYFMVAARNLNQLAGQGWPGSPGHDFVR